MSRPCGGAGAQEEVSRAKDVDESLARGVKRLMDVMVHSQAG